MRKHLAIAILLACIALKSAAQWTQPERTALRAIEKNRWKSAETALRKAIRKDSVNALAQYIFSVYFFSKNNPSQSIDSAYRHVMLALRDFYSASPREREKLKKFNIDSAALVAQRERVDSAAFRRASAENTEQAYLLFLKDHPHAPQQKEAEELRDEMAYLNAARQNTHEAFHDFLRKYPSAARAAEAKTKYDRLLYEARTKDKRLESFETFLREHPETPFRKEIERNIFERFTLSGEAERYLAFLQLYPNSSQAKRARDILYYILAEKEEVHQPDLFLTDSLLNISRLQQSYLVPFLKAGKFGFMDKEGAEIIRATVNYLVEDYKCGNIVEDVIVLDTRILARDGTVIYSGSIEELEDIGTGFLRLKIDDCHTVIHKSGFLVDACVDDAKILGNRFLSILKNNQWLIYSLTGHQILDEPWEDIQLNDNIIAFKKASQWRLTTLNTFLQMADQQRLILSEPFDQVKKLTNGTVWVKTDSLEGVLDRQLSYVIPFDHHKIKPVFFGFLTESAKRYSLYDHTGKKASYFDTVRLNEPWVVVRRDSSDYLFDVQRMQVKPRAFDSITFEGAFVGASKADTLHIYFSEDEFFELTKPAKVQFIPGKDSTAFIMIEVPAAGSREKAAATNKTIYNIKGKKLFTTICDAVQYAGRDLFIIQKKAKKGLINAAGKMILPVEYDAIGSVFNNVISLLKAMKFGLYDIERHQLIKPQYDKNLMPYANRFIAAFRNGSYNFISWDARHNDKNKFDEVMYWNDTIAFVRKNQLWSLYDIGKKETVADEIEEIKVIYDSPAEKLAIIKQQGAYGVFSSKRGIIIPSAFSDIINVGSPEEPLYFTEKHVEEAAVFIVIYYDKNGRMLRREVYEDIEEYEKIYCPSD